MYESMRERERERTMILQLSLVLPGRAKTCAGVASDVIGTGEKRLCWYLKTMAEASKVS